MIIRIVLMVTLIAITLTGCTGMRPEHYAGTQPALNLEDYFQGEVRAWGLFQDRKGEVRRQFTVDIRGVLEDDGTLVLTEDFVYDDGETSQRIWRINKLDAHRYEGRADDVVDTAQGVVYGKALNWRYVLKLKVGEKTYNVRFNDWMFMHADGVLVNRATLSKYGVRLGEVTLFFKKAGA